MIPRQYQEEMVSKALKALKKHGNTICIAPTGSGKTIIFSLLAGQVPGRKLIIQNRLELVRQNVAKYRAVNPGASVSIFTGKIRDVSGETIFATSQTVSRYMDEIPPLNLLVLDEAQHTTADTWLRITRAAREKNPKLFLAGFTATPARADKKTIKHVFTNIADVIRLQDLISQGFLVPPVAYVLDADGTKRSLDSIKVGSETGEQFEVEKILNTPVANEAVIENWLDKAKDRSTIIFCSTVNHAKDVAQLFNERGISCKCVHGGMKQEDVEQAIHSFNNGDIRVLTNCMLFTEGFDSQRIGCVVLLRKCSYKSSLIQMIGRGLRVVDQSIFPGVEKDDCIILDFGTSILSCQDIEVDETLQSARQSEDAPMKKCPACQKMVPFREKVCQLCGHVFGLLEDIDLTEESVEIKHAILTPIDIINRSPFRYVELWGKKGAIMACGFNAWAGVFSTDGEHWVSIGKLKEWKHPVTLCRGSKIVCISSSNDFMRDNEDNKASRKSRSWQKALLTVKQAKLLLRLGYRCSVPDTFNFSREKTLSRYEATCLISFVLAQNDIKNLMGVLS